MRSHQSCRESREGLLSLLVKINLQRKEVEVDLEICEIAKKSRKRNQSLGNGLEVVKTYCKREPDNRLMLNRDRLYRDRELSGVCRKC